MRASHADIASLVTPFDRLLQGDNAVSNILDPTTRHGTAMLDQMINHEAQIIAYNNNFRSDAAGGGAAAAGDAKHVPKPVVAPAAGPKA